MSLNCLHKLMFFITQFLKNKIVDTNVSTKWSFFACFLNFESLIPKYFQGFSIQGVKLVTKNTLKSMVTTVFCSFLVTVLGPPPYENGPFFGSSDRFGDFFYAMSEVVTIKNRTADFNFDVKRK